MKQGKGTCLRGARTRGGLILRGLVCGYVAKAERGVNQRRETSPTCRPGGQREREERRGAVGAVGGARLAEGEGESIARPGCRERAREKEGRGLRCCAERAKA